MTLEEAKKLTRGDVLHFDLGERCERWRVNGKVLTWKKQPDRILIPAKFGLYDYTHFSQNDLGSLHLEKNCLRVLGRREDR